MKQLIHQGQPKPHPSGWTGHRSPCKPPENLLTLRFWDAGPLIQNMQNHLIGSPLSLQLHQAWAVEQGVGDQGPQALLQALAIGPEQQHRF